MLLPLLRSFAAKLGHFLALYGAWGLFAISFFDSSFLSLPLLNDLLLIHFAGQSPGRAPIYVVLSVAGSVLGSSTAYGLARGGGALLWRRRSPKAVSLAGRWLEGNDFVSILVTSLLPPPMPFKPFVIAAGLFRMNVLRFGLALLVGRSLRFTVDALLGVRYGVRAEAYFRANLGWVSFAIVALVLGMTLLYRFLSRRFRPGPPPGPSTLSP